MEWTTIIVALISAFVPSGLIGIFTIREQRKNAKLENEAKEIENKDHELEMSLKLIDELQSQNDALNLRLEKKDAVIESKDKIIDNLKETLDKIRTRYGMCQLLRCQVVSCESRQPKLGTRDVDLDEIMKDVEERK